jgi:hypothetical protein
MMQYVGQGFHHISLMISTSVKKKVLSSRGDANSFSLQHTNRYSVYFLRVSLCSFGHEVNQMNAKEEYSNSMWNLYVFFSKITECIYTGSGRET